MPKKQFNVAFKDRFGKVIIRDVITADSKKQAERKFLKGRIASSQDFSLRKRRK